MTKLDSFSDQQFCDIIQNSFSFSEARRKFGYCEYGRYVNDLIRERCDTLDLSLDHFSRKKQDPNIRQTTRKEDIFIQNSTYRNMASLKRKIISNKILQYKCCICGNNGVWNDKSLSLQIDHVNGIHSDNRIQNLRFLCPNCHSQTQTYAGKGQLRANKNAQRLYSAGLSS